MVPDNKVTVKGLTEGKPYEFRVAAVNDAGPGEYAETKEAIKPAPPPSQFQIFCSSRVKFRFVLLYETFEHKRKLGSVYEEGPRF